MAYDSIHISSGRPVEESPEDQFLTQMERLVSNYRNKDLQASTFESSYRRIPSARDRFALVCVAIESGLDFEAIYRVVKDSTMPENQIIDEKFFVQAIQKHFHDNGFFPSPVAKLLSDSIEHYKKSLEATEISEVSSDIAQQIHSNESE